MTGAAVGGDVRTARLIAFVVAAGAYGWWLTGFQPFTTPPLILVSVPAVMVLAVGARRLPPPTSVRRWFAELGAGWRRATGRGEPEERRPARAGLLWAVAILSLTTVQLFAYFAGSGGPRRDHPTLSWLVGHVDFRVGRAALFVLWLGVGLRLVRR